MNTWGTVIIGAGNAVLLNQHERPTSRQQSGDPQFALAAVFALLARAA